jgi:hypothetical protein
VKRDCNPFRGTPSGLSLRANPCKVGPNPSLRAGVATLRHT